MNKPQAVRRNIRPRKIRVFGEEEIKKELDEIGEVIKRESSIDNAVGTYNDMVKAFSRDREKSNS